MLQSVHNSILQLLCAKAGLSFTELLLFYKVMSILGRGTVVNQRWLNLQQLVRNSQHALLFGGVEEPSTIFALVWVRTGSKPQ